MLGQSGGIKDISSSSCVTLPLHAIHRHWKFQVMQPMWHRHQGHDIIKVPLELSTRFWIVQDGGSEVIVFHAQRCLLKVRWTNVLVVFES